MSGVTCERVVSVRYYSEGILALEFATRHILGINGEISDLKFKEMQSELLELDKMFPKVDDPYENRYFISSDVAQRGIGLGERISEYGSLTGRWDIKEMGGLIGIALNMCQEAIRSPNLVTRPLKIAGYTEGEIGVWETLARINRRFRN